MSIPLSFLPALPGPSSGSSLGDALAQQVTDCGRVTTLLDCLPTTSSPAVYAVDASRPPLCHSTIHSFVSSFILPTSASTPPLGPNDRVMVVLPTGAANALALLALASYHTCAPVNASCTASELREDAERLRARAVVTTRSAEDRLQLRRLRAELGCEIVYIEERASGEAGLFDMHTMDGSEGTLDERVPHRLPSRLHGLKDQSLVLHTSGTSGKKKVVPYTLRSLIIGTCAVVKSWDLKADDVNSKNFQCADFICVLCADGGSIYLSEHDASVPRRRHRPQSLLAHHVWRCCGHVSGLRRDNVLEPCAELWCDMVRCCCRSLR